MRSNGKFRSRMTGSIATMAALALLTISAPIAAAGTGGAPTPSGSPPPPGSTDGAPAAAPSAGVLTLLAAETTPRKSFYFGYRYELF